MNGGKPEPFRYGTVRTVGNGPFAPRTGFQKINEKSVRTAQTFQKHLRQEDSAIGGTGKR